MAIAVIRHDVGRTEVISEGWLADERPLFGDSHLSVTRDGRQVMTSCTISVQGPVIDLSYDGLPNDMSGPPGTLRIRFSDHRRHTVARVEWRGAADGEFQSCPVTIEHLPDIAAGIDLDAGDYDLVAMLSHLHQERSPAFVKKKKEAVLRARGTLKCEACRLDFSSRYGSFGLDLAEVHIIARRDAFLDQEVGEQDAAILCSNCHHLIHRTNPMLSVSEFVIRHLMTPLL